MLKQKTKTVQIQDMIKEKQKQKNISLKPIYKILKLFIKQKHLLIYGGTAIDIMMPKNLKIYSSFDVPDYDVFSVTPKEHAFELADLFVKQNYKYVEVKPGIHTGTYKVSVEFNSVLDITEISPDLYKTLCSMSKSYKKALPVVPVEYLKMAIHHELSKPQEHIERWEKIYPRLKRLNSTYETKSSVLKPRYNPIPKELLDYFEKESKVNNFIFTGFLALKHYLLDKTYSPHIIEIIAEDPISIVDNFAKSYHDFTIQYVKGDELLSDVYHILQNNTIVVKVYYIEGCISYFTKKIKKIASFDSLAWFFYCRLIQTYGTPEQQNIEWAISQLLTNEPSVNRFHSKCLGKQKTKEDVLKLRWDNKRHLSIYRPNERKSKVD